MLKPRSPQASFYGSYLYDKIVPAILSQSRKERKEKWGHRAR
jgi:hypothetical protein